MKSEVSDAARSVVTSSSGPDAANSPPVGKNVAAGAETSAGAKIRPASPLSAPKATKGKAKVGRKPENPDMMQAQIALKAATKIQRNFRGKTGRKVSDEIRAVKQAEINEVQDSGLMIKGQRLFLPPAPHDQGISHHRPVAHLDHEGQGDEEHEVIPCPITDQLIDYRAAEALMAEKAQHAFDMILPNVVAHHIISRGAHG